MKKIKTFENWLGQKFFTGHSNSDEKDNSKKRIDAEIDNAIDEYKNNQSAFINYDETKLKEKLSQSAKDDNYRGKVIIKKSNDNRSANYNKNFIIYISKKSPIQNLGSAAANARRS